MTKLSIDQVSGNIVHAIDFMTAAETSDVLSRSATIDVTSAIDAAYAAALSLKSALILPEGIMLISSQLTWTGEVSVIGAGGSEGTTQGTQFLKDGNFTGIYISNSEGSTFAKFSVVGKAGNGGLGVDVYWGNRSKFYDLSIRNHGSHGMLVRAGNLGSYRDIVTNGNGGDGIRWDSGTGYGQANELGEGTGATQTANACVVENIDAVGNTGIGFNIVSSNANWFNMITAQNNTGAGLQCADDRNLIIFYDESNGASSNLTAAAQGNFVTCIQGGIVDNNSADDDTGNMILDYNQAGTNRYSFTKLWANQFIMQDKETAAVSNPWKITEDGTSTEHVLTIDDLGSSAIKGTIKITHSAGNVVNMELGGTLTCDSIIENQIYTLTSADTTPSVEGFSDIIVDTGFTGNITDLDDGVVGQTIRISANVNVTITHTAAQLELIAGDFFVMRAGDTVTFHMFETGVWKEVARSAHKIPFSNDNFSNPPTDAELDSAFGTPAVVGPGFSVIIDDAGGETNCYQCVTSVASWWITTLTKAT